MADLSASKAGVIARLVNGDKIHMQYRDGARQWWFEEPRADVADAIMQQVQAAGALVEAGDSLFGLPRNSQTWLSDRFGDAP